MLHAPAGESHPLAGQTVEAGGSASDTGSYGRGRLRLSHQLTNLLVASLWLFYAWSRFELWRHSHAPVYLMLVLRNSALTLLFLCRRPAKVTSTSIKEWSVAVVGTFVGYFYEPRIPVLPSVNLFLVVAAGGLSIASILALGRSFGIVPANRGIVTRGPYSIVRHPIYLSYMVFDVGYLAVAPSVRNAVVLVVFAVLAYLRATYEERLLGMDPEYREYADRTRYMFLPGVL